MRKWLRRLMNLILQDWGFSISEMKGRDAVRPTQPQDADAAADQQAVGAVFEVAGVKFLVCRSSCGGSHCSFSRSVFLVFMQFCRIEEGLKGLRRSVLRVWRGQRGLVLARIGRAGSTAKSNTTPLRAGIFCQ